MLDKPQLVQTTAKIAAVIRLTIPREEIRTVMGPAMGEVIAAAQAQEIGPIGPLFSHHFRMDPATFDFEVGVPVSKPVTPAGRVQPGQLPAMKVVRTNYRGPYEGLGDAWHKFCEWITANGYSPAPNFWECYVSGPETSPDPANWCTELNRPLL